MRIDILTLFPEIALAPLGDSIIRCERIKIRLEFWKAMQSKSAE